MDKIDKINNMLKIINFLNDINTLYHFFIEKNITVGALLFLLGLGLKVYIFASKNIPKLRDFLSLHFLNQKIGNKYFNIISIIFILYFICVFLIILSLYDILEESNIQLLYLPNAFYSLAILFLNLLFKMDEKHINAYVVISLIPLLIIAIYGFIEMGISFSSLLLILFLIAVLSVPIFLMDYLVTKICGFD